MKATTPNVHYVDNPNKHMNDLNLTHSEHIISSHIGGNLSWDEPMHHDEPYGYEREDDPFEPHGKLDAPFLYLLLGTLLFVHFNYTAFRPQFNIAEREMHQRITMNQIEDGIRELRKEGWAVQNGATD